MTRPYFEVGEVAIIQSSHPKAAMVNGECTILEILPPHGIEINRKDPEGAITNSCDQFSYWTTASYASREQQISGYVRQSSLRKKHQPPEGTESFTELLNTLNSELIL